MAKTYAQYLDSHPYYALVKAGADIGIDRDTLNRSDKADIVAILAARPQIQMQVRQSLLATRGQVRNYRRERRSIRGGR